jgi:hypothetical protein
MRVMKIEFPVILAVVSATLTPAIAQQITRQEVTAVQKCVRQVQALYPAQDDSRMSDRTAAYKACIANNGTIPGTTGSGTPSSK